MKAYDLNLQSDLVNVYDQTKNTLMGRYAIRTVGSKVVIGPATNKYVDVGTDTSGAITAISAVYLTENNRLFILGQFSGTSYICAMYNFDTATGAQPTYVGRCVLSAPLVSVIRGFKVLDAVSTNIKVCIATTNTVLQYGGLMVSNKLAVADFQPSGGVTLFFATGSDQKAMYHADDSTAIGINNPLTSAAGISLDSANSKVYLHNGTAAVHQFATIDIAATPNTDAGQTFTVTIASPGVVTAALHGYNNNDPIALYTTGALPTGLTASVAGTSQTIFFVRNATANTFELSATSGGASINTTGTQSGVHTVRRANGSTTSWSFIRTGNLPALAGTLLVNNSEDLATPSHSANSGFDCVAFSTTTNLYFGKVSELTAAAITWPSLITSNVQGNLGIFTTIAPLNVNYSTVLDRFIMFQNGRFFFKQLINNSIDSAFGATRMTQLVGQNPINLPIGAVTFNGMDMKNGWLALGYSSAGQLGVQISDARSDCIYDYSSIISKVFDLDNDALVSLKVFQDYEYSNNYIRVQYRTSGFGSAAGGWIDLNKELDLSAVATAAQIQFKFCSTQSMDASGQFSYIGDAILITQPKNEISDKWSGSVDNTTESNISPAKTAFRLQKAYAVSVPTMYFRAHDDAGNLILSADTSANAAMFEYSTNNGTSWNPLGSVPNTALTTELRYNWATPPGVRVICSLRES
jgi:hypothetical protein